MTNFYMITPLEKKSIKLIADMYREVDGEQQGFQIHDTYRWGRGFLADDELPARGEDQIMCSAEMDLDYDLDDRVALWIDAEDDDTAALQEEILQAYRDGGVQWLYENEDDWQIESLDLEITGPYRIDLVDDQGNILQENVQPGD